MQEEYNTLKYAGSGLLILLFVATIMFVLRKQVDEDFFSSTSDSSNIVINGSIDSWIGNGPMGSDLLQNKLRAQNINLNWKNDGAIYKTKISRINNDEADIALLTVGAHDINLLKGRHEGVEIFVIDESDGGDGTLVWKECGIDKIEDLNIKPAFGIENPDGWKMTFLTNSPSHQQVRTIGKDFGVDIFLKKDKPWFVEPNSDKESFGLFKDKKVCLLTTFEPYKSRALKLDGVKELYSSKLVDKDIVDILLVRRELLKEDHPKHSALKTVISTYFDVLKELRTDEDLMLSEMRKFFYEYSNANVSDDDIRSMIKGVKWINLKDNAEGWLGLGGKKYFGLLEAHESARNIIMADEEFSGHLENFDFSTIINSSIIRELYLGGGYSDISDETTITDSLSINFTKLSIEQWLALSEIGKLRAKPIIFSSENTSLTNRTKDFIDEVMMEFKRYPKFRLELIPGYKSKKDIKHQQKIAFQRANKVKQYIIDKYGVSENRIRIYVPKLAQLQKIIPKHANESSRTYNGRMRQVHFILKTVSR